MLDDIQERFEFLVDAKTGTVLEVIADKGGFPLGEPLIFEIVGID